MPPQEPPGSKAGEMAHFQRLRRTYIESPTLENKEKLITFVRGAKDTKPRQMASAFALACCRTLFDHDDPAAIYVATFITTNEHRLAIDRHLQVSALKKPPVPFSKRKPTHPHPQGETRRIPTPQTTKVEPSTPYDRHRNFIKKNSLRALSRIRSFVARFPNPWIK